MIHSSSIAKRSQIHNLCELVLITLSKCSQTDVGRSAVTLKKMLLMKFMIHTNQRRANKVCLITHPRGPEAVTLQGNLMLGKPMSCFQKCFRMSGKPHVTVTQEIEDMLFKHEISWGENHKCYLDEQDLKLW